MKTLLSGVVGILTVLTLVVIGIANDSYGMPNYLAVLFTILTVLVCLMTIMNSD